jgi:hypothetical protein
METINHKGIEISKTETGYFIFVYHGCTYTNTNLRFSKTLINKLLKNQ